MGRRQDAILWRKFGNVVRRIDSVTRDVKSGYGIVTISMLVGDDGEPKFWTEPILRKIEPKNVRVSDIFLHLTGVPQLFFGQDEEEEEDSTD